MLDQEALMRTKEFVTFAELKANNAKLKDSLKDCLSIIESMAGEILPDGTDYLAAFSFADMDILMKAEKLCTNS